MVKYGGFDSTWVSTDHPGIASCASGFEGNCFYFNRYIAETGKNALMYCDEDYYPLKNCT